MEGRGRAGGVSRKRDGKVKDGRQERKTAPGTSDGRGGRLSNSRTTISSSTRPTGTRRQWRAGHRTISDRVLCPTRWSGERLWPGSPKGEARDDDFGASRGLPATKLGTFGAGGGGRAAQVRAGLPWLPLRLPLSLSLPQSLSLAAAVAAASCSCELMRPGSGKLLRDAAGPDGMDHGGGGRWDGGPHCRLEET